MVTEEKFMKGLRAYADAEILQKLPKKSAKRFAMATVVDLISESSIHSPFVDMLGVTHEGMVDVDKLTDKMKRNMPEEGIELPIKVFGIHFTDMIFKRSDVDSLRNYVMNA
jgi:hypothetical protein